MSGHSKWATTKYRKGAQDSARAKVFAKIIRQVEVAAREGGSDMTANASLRTMYAKARDSSVPIDTIERAIKRGSGEVVDVRDVVDMHILVMTHPAARGERFLAVAGDSISIVEVAKLLKSRMGESARRVPTRQLPDWVVRLAALRVPDVKLVLPELGKVRNASSDKAKRVLGWPPR